jgi:exopolysaccharide biosynthesis polyprenyl glycosylphosphotransferase
MMPNATLTASEKATRPLPRTDARQRMDEAARRGWIEIGRRLCRVGALVLTDTVGLVLATLLADVVLGMLGWGARGAAWSLFRLVVFVQPLAIAAAGSYGAGQNRVSFGRLGLGISLSLVLALMQASLAGVDPPVAPLFPATPAVFWVSSLAVLFAARRVVNWLVNSAYGIGLGQRRVLVIGTEAEAAKMERTLARHGATEIRIVGRLSPSHRREAGALEVVSELESAIQAYDAWGVLVASTNLSFEALETVFHRCFELGVAVSVIPKTLYRFGPRLELRKTRAGALLRLHPRELGIPQLTIKRAMDMALSVLLLVLATPLLLLIAVAIGVDSRGPILFRQTRAGLGGLPFGMFKFRTMVENADEIKSQLEHLNQSGDPRLFKIPDDPRVTRIGRFLRRTSLDELPQLLNVLRGEMSLIGPRPFFLEDFDRYADHHFERLTVLPGITGWWQVRGRSAVVDFEEVVRLDREYIDQWSVWFDLKILLLTLPAVMRRTGAY